MIPLRDENAHKTFPLAVATIVIANVALFVYQWLVGPRGFEQYVLAFGLIPAELTYSVEVMIPGRLSVAGATLVSSIFMHGGIAHLLLNMWVLWVFGDNIEDTLGHGRFLLFYLATGVLASLTHVAIDPSSTVPLVGASGAIAGIMGAYFLLFPRNRVLTVNPFWMTLLPFSLFFLRPVIRLPAAFFLAFWFLLQLVYSMTGGNVAWWAHIGGFLAGFVLITFFVPKK